MPLTTTISATLSATDGVTSILNKNISTTSSGILLDYSSSFGVNSTPASIPLPASPLQFVYVKNIGTVNVVVTWTPNGGSSAVTQTLTPTSYIMFIQNTTGQGITALSVATASSSSFIEYVIGG